MQTRSLINFLPALSFCTIVFFPNSDSLGLLTLKADGRRGVHGGGVSVVSRLSLGGVSVVCRWHLGGVSVASRWCPFVAPWWCLCGVLVLSR